MCLNQYGIELNYAGAHNPAVADCIT